MTEGTPPVSGGLKHFKWTPDNITWLRTRAFAGKSANEIAAEIGGVPARRIRSACERFGIKLNGRAGRRSLMRPGVLTVLIPEDMTPPIVRLAGKYRKRPDEIAAALMRGLLEMGDTFIENILDVE